MDNIKKVDCALLPPCAKTLWNKTKRAQYLSIIWGNADSSQPGHDLNPLLYGWKQAHGHFTPEWFPGPDVPDNLFDEISTDSEPTTADEATSDEDEWSDDSETE